MKVGLFGTGAYGLAISSILTHNKCEVTMWTKFPEERDELLKTKCGSPSYAAPEYYISEQKIDEKYDMWSLYIPGKY